MIPMVLVNGVAGIGTGQFARSSLVDLTRLATVAGFSTSVPSYNPLDVIANLRSAAANQ